MATHPGIKTRATFAKNTHFSGNIMSKRSPMKSLSVRDGKDGKRSLHVKRGEKKYESVANFFFEVIGFVRCPSELQRMNGYLLEVTRRSDGITMRCYVTCDEMGNSKAVRNAINRTFSAMGGVFWNDVTDKQLNEYWMKVLDEYLERPKHLQNVKKAALHLGRQDGDVYVISENVQLDRHGVLIPVEEQTYILMTPYLQGLFSSSEKSLLREYTKVVPVPLSTFMESARDFMGPNFVQFLMLLAGSLSAFHYQKVLSVVGSCPAPMAIGETGSGKSTCLQLIHKLLGGTLVSQSSGESVATELIKSTFPVYWDDPTHPKTVKKVLVSTFQGGRKQTKGSGNEVPLTTFVMTVNFSLDEDMRSFERTTPILFEKLVTKSVDDAFMREKRELFDKASTSCLPSVIRMGRDLREEDLQHHVSFFHEKLVGLASRLPSIYSCYRYFAKELIDNVNDPTVMTLEDFDKHVTGKLVPYVVSQYNTTTKVMATLDQLFSDLISAVGKTNGQQVHKWIRPSVNQRNATQGGPAMHIHKAELTRVLARAGTPYSAANLSTLCSGINGASDDFRSNFGKSQRELSIKIPREAVNKDHLKTIDSWFCIEQDDIEEIEDNDCNTCEGCQKLSHEIALLKTKMREREDRIHQEYDEKIGVLKERVLEERERSERELLSAKKTIEQLKMELAQTKKVEKQPDGPVVTSSLAKITEDLPSDKSINDSGFLDADDAERQSSSQSAETSEQPSDQRENTAQTGRGKKRKGTAVCSICPSIKRSNMLQCNSCKQWQHSKCAGITAKDYDINYVCQICKEKK